MAITITSTRTGLVVAHGGEHRLAPSDATLDGLLTAEAPLSLTEEWFAAGQPTGRPDDREIVAPIMSQEVWAAGVTYLRSRDAREIESRESGADVFYDMVYEAARPELFFKATPHRVVGHGGPVRIRRDSTWDVPEPELVLVIDAAANIVGYTIGNDMSSRSIEGENPLYLPQAKVYSGCAALGPRIVVADEPLPPTTAVRLEIVRSESCVFAGSTTIDQIKRSFAELVDHLFLDNEFPRGVFLMTGTGIVPDDDFTLRAHDEIRIAIDGIGTLVNHVIVGD